MNPVVLRGGPTPPSFNSGSAGIEPTLLVSETSVIPFHHDPIFTSYFYIFSYYRFSLFTFHFSLIFPYFIAHTFCLNTTFYHLFVFIELRNSTFDFKKNNLTQISLWESIEDKIIDSFSQKYQILVRIGKIWQ